MPAGVQHFPDPDVQFGSFKVYKRTDGKFVVVDVRKAPGERTLRAFDTLEHARLVASAWHRQGHG